MLNKLRTRLRALLRKSEMERELDEELRHHIERQTEQNVRLGMNPEEARREARKAFGGVERAKERSRDARGMRWIGDLWQDLRYGARMLMKNPGFTLIAALTLALGIGANSALFGLLDAVMLRTLTVPRPEELVLVATRTSEGGLHSDFSYPLYAALRDNNDVFAGMLASSDASFGLSSGSQTERARGEYVSANYFSALGLTLSRGT